MTTKFSNTFKNPTFGPFSTFSRQKVSLNSGSVMHNTTWASNTMLRIKNKQKKRKKRANPKLLDRRVVFKESIEILFKFWVKICLILKKPNCRVQKVFPSYAHLISKSFGIKPL